MPVNVLLISVVREGVALEKRAIVEEISMFHPQYQEDVHFVSQRAWKISLLCPLHLLLGTTDRLKR